MKLRAQFWREQAFETLHTEGLEHDSGQLGFLERLHATARLLPFDYFSFKLYNYFLKLCNYFLKM
jgi:hypothetical protein